MATLGVGRPTNPAVLVGTETGDDAGVYRISDEIAVVCTADFITPVADDPRLYGQVAAANALSDVYAMGGAPLCAVALCLFPKDLEVEAAREILAGGEDKAAEAAAAIVGGHTVRNSELLYGLSVTGRVHPRKIVRNVGARPGDVLVLSKPLGSGLVINGLRKNAIALDEARPVLSRLAELNRRASEIMLEEGAHAATDVTGFGLAGHSLGMARGSGVGIHFSLSALPLYPHVQRLFEAGVKTQSTQPNCDHVSPSVRDSNLSPFWQALVYDPQTSGGLLMALEPASAARALEKMSDAGLMAAQVGEVVEVGGGEAHLRFVA
jgi:selenide,water dikinase